MQGAIEGASLNGAAGPGPAPPKPDARLAEWLGIEPEAENFTVYLPKAAQLAGINYREITLVEPTLGQVEDAAKQTGLLQDIALISAVAGVPERVVRMLSYSEYRKAIAYLNVFLLAGPSADSLPG